LREIDIDFDRFLDTRGVQALAGFVSVCLKHQLQSVPEVSPAFAKRLAMGNRAGNFLDPTHKPSIALRLDDGVVSLFHTDTM
jgi:hypothetical protein